MNVAIRVVTFIYFLKSSYRISRHCRLTVHKQLQESWSSSVLLLFSCQNWLDLQVPFECLIEKKTSMEGFNDWQPRQNSNRSKKNYPHSIIKFSSKCTCEVPQPCVLYFWPCSLCNLNQQNVFHGLSPGKNHGKQIEKVTQFSSSKVAKSFITIINPHAVGMNARQQTKRSVNDNSHIIERVKMMARTARNRNALKNLNPSW